MPELVSGEQCLDYFRTVFFAGTIHESNKSAYFE